MARAYSLDLRERVGRKLPVSGGNLQGQRCQRTEVVTAVSRDWKRRSPPMGGHRPYVLSSEWDWLLKRLAQQPDIILRALLAARGIKVSYYALWHFFEHEGISFKKGLHPSWRTLTPVRLVLAEALDEPGGRKERVSAPALPLEPDLRCARKPLLGYSLKLEPRRSSWG
ncbi:hypothetical protein [Bradyrhizobium zhanjiangense]|uniref:Transposase n=1 Tax=Bradyrhizobium zhanjiangense TaxID=1325107 RepID=A0ABY0DB36_9BRAD|nr:hypothetical protein [Bradyrhizobium zhanjiangense]RXG86629.1 hypothetical protein EAS62_37105 [Bradyrhizobium zhanjiangense]